MESLQGKLLIASPSLLDPNFRRTVVLVTEHDTETGRVRVVDCLAMREGRPVLVRRVEGMSGFVPMRMELIVRFDYGSVVPWVSRSHGNWQAIAGPDGLEMDTPVELRGQNLTTTAEFTVQRRERVPFVLGWFPSHDPQPLPRNAAQLIAQFLRAGVVANIDAGQTLGEHGLIAACERPLGEIVGEAFGQEMIAA